MIRIPTIETDQPVLVFGGPYSNLQATQALFAFADANGFDSSRIICTGDLTAYCGSPTETIDLIQSREIPVVMGNTDEQLARDADDCGCGFEAGSACDRLSAAWYAYAAAQVTGEQKRYLGTFAPRIDLVIAGKRFAIVHGRLEQINAFVFPGTDDAAKSHDVLHADADGIICGHSGLPFTQVVDGKIWHNAGVIGMPANDGTPRVWFSLIKPCSDGRVIFEHRALNYDFRSAQAAMRAAGLPVDYHDAIASGLWPSVDILPDVDRSASGEPLAFEPVVFASAQDELQKADAA